MTYSRKGGTKRGIGGDSHAAIHIPPKKGSEDTSMLSGHPFTSIPRNFNRLSKRSLGTSAKVDSADQENSMFDDIRPDMIKEYPYFEMGSIEDWIQDEGGQLIRLHYRDCDCNIRESLPFQQVAKLADAPEALAGLSIGSGLLMGVTFLCLNKSMGLSDPSPAMNWARASLPTRNKKKC
jgi:hypothetical protein